MNSFYVRKEIRSIAFCFMILSLVTCHKPLYSQIIESGIQIGEKVPNILLEKFLDDKTKSIRFSELKGKVVLMDFWSIYCSACIKDMPRLDSLQAYYGEKIAIVLVTRNTEQEVTKLFTRLGIKLPHLSIIVQDIALNTLFPHQSEPHQVWIDSEGIYRHTTYSYNATKENIDSFTTGGGLYLSSKLEDLDFGVYESLMAQSYQNLAPLLDRYSILLKGTFNRTTSDLIVSIPDSVSGKMIGFKAINKSPLELLQCAFNYDVYGFEVDLNSLKVNLRMIIEVEDHDPLFPPQNPALIDKWKSENLFSYEIQMKRGFDALTREQMQREFNSAFPYKGAIEVRNVKCNILEWEASSSSILTKNDEPSIQFKNGYIKLTNQPITKLVEKIIYSQDVSDLPLVDNTQLSGNIDIELAVDKLNDIVYLEQQLNKYGLSIRKGMKEIPMLIIKDK